jgi:pyruvate,orthophosphate dikinase
VAGIRMTRDINQMAQKKCPRPTPNSKHRRKLEKHYREMQDVEFTIEKGKLWMLQTRDGKRTAQAAVRIAVDMAEEGLITRKEAVLRVNRIRWTSSCTPSSTDAIQGGPPKGSCWPEGLNVSPGAAVGMVAFDADLAEAWAKNEGKRSSWCARKPNPTTSTACWPPRAFSPAAGGRTSHAALVARQFGKPAVVGVEALKIDMAKRQMTGGQGHPEGDWISIDGTRGGVSWGSWTTMVPDIKDPWLIKLLGWADEYRTLGVWANADYPQDARGPANTAPRASACAAPSTCSSRPTGCRSSRK